MMSQDRINRIITEETTKVVLQEGISDTLKKAFDKFFKVKKKHEKSISDKKRHEKKDKGKENTKKTKKTAKGGKVTYDYEEYKEKHKDISQGDMKSLANSIDQDRTNIRDLAQDIFPDHTKNGGQSQLRKILNGDRKMTKDVAHKLSKGITSGKIAVKK